MGLKRAQTDDHPVSPPPTKRKVVSTTSTAKAVNNFFKPASQKEAIPLQWPNTGSSLLKAKYKVSNDTFAGRTKIAAFDFDDTLITTSSGNVFGKTAEDWKWWTHEVPTELRQLWSDNYVVAIVSNQAGISMKQDKNGVSEKKNLAKFKGKVGFVLGALDIPILLYAATEKDNFRKPRTGMWDELMKDLGFPTIDLKDGASFFVGDAAGRAADDVKKIKKDHSNTDRGFAENIGLAFYTPQKFFLDEEERPYHTTMDPSLYTVPMDGGKVRDFKFEKAVDVELVVFCGSPGSGKSTLYWNVFKPLGFERVNQDILKTRDRCLQKASEFLKASTSVVVDNTNADIDVRSKWIALGREHSVPVRLVWLTTPTEVCQHNNAVRAFNLASHENGTSSDSHAKDNKPIASKEDIKNGNIPTTGFNPEKRELLPAMAFSGFKSRFQQPKVEEGFFDVTEVEFQFRGTPEQKVIWSKHWI